MKSVKVTNISVQEGLPTVDYEVEMISVHDTKGKFGIGFMIINDKQPKLAIFDDDRKILATLDEKQRSLDFIDSVIKNKGYKSRIKYVTPVTPEAQGYSVAVPALVEQHTKVEGDNFDNFIRCREIIQTGEFPKEGSIKWRTI